MEKVGKQELCSCQKRDKYDGVGKTLERCVFVDEDYAKLLGVLFIEEEDKPNCTCNDVEDDPLYMNFLANTKLDGTSYVSKVNDQNGLPVFINYEKDRELEIHGVEKDQDNVREKYKMGEGSKGLKANARENRELESHGVGKGHDNVREKYKLGWSSKALKTNARKNRMEDGILSKKRGNEDRDLHNRKQRIDVEIVPGKEQKMEDGILSKKLRNEDRDFDNRKPKHQIDVNIVPGKEQQMKDDILSKRRENKDMDLDNRNHRIDVKIVHGKKQKMNDGILSNKRGNEDRDFDNWKHLIDVNIITGKEQKIQNDSKFMDAEVKIEPKEDSDSLKEAISQSEVEILENVGAEVGWGSSSNPFVPSVEHCLNLDATIIDSRYRKEVLNLLMRPYNEEEYKKLWKDIKMQLPSSSTNGRGKSLLSHHKALEEGRGSSSNPFVPSVEHRQNLCIKLDATIIDFAYRKEVLNLLMRPYNEEEYKKFWKDIKIHLPSSSTNGSGKSLLSRHKAVNRAIKRTNHDKDKKLNIMRGFFFWLEHLTRQDAFQPWEDAECLQTMPGSS